jgi:hypothetical protein
MIGIIERLRAHASRGWLKQQMISGCWRERVLFEVR